MHLIQRNDQLKIKDFKYIIIDTDCGGDDSQALIVLDYYVKKYNKVLLGITCCEGNASVENVCTNVMIVQAICKSSYPIYLGRNCSFNGESLKDYFFAQDGLGEVQKKYLQQYNVDKSLKKDVPAYKFIAQSAIKYSGEIAIVCIGPLTNLALAYQYDNRIVNSFTNISIMGCADTLAGMNEYYVSQFNIGLDPEAAHIIFKKFNNIIISSIDTTTLTIDNNQTVCLFKSQKAPKGLFVKQVYDYQFRKPIVPLLVDPLAVVVLFQPQMVKEGSFVQMNIKIKGHRTRGCSLINYFSSSKNSYLIRKFDQDEVIQEILRIYE